MSRNLVSNIQDVRRHSQLISDSYRHKWKVTLNVPIYQMTVSYTLLIDMFIKIFKFNKPLIKAKAISMEIKILMCIKLIQNIIDL